MSVKINARYTMKNTTHRMNNPIPTQPSTRPSDAGTPSASAFFASDIANGPKMAPRLKIPRTPNTAASRACRMPSMYQRNCPIVTGC